MWEKASEESAAIHGRPSLSVQCVDSGPTCMARPVIKTCIVCARECVSVGQES